VKNLKVMAKATFFWSLFHKYIFFYFTGKYLSTLRLMCHMISSCPKLTSNMECSD